MGIDIELLLSCYFQCTYRLDRMQDTIDVTLMYAELLLGYFDKAAYPQPAFYNPIPWQPVEVPFDGRPSKSGKRRQTDKR